MHACLGFVFVFFHCNINPVCLEGHACVGGFADGSSFYQAFSAECQFIAFANCLVPT